MKSLVDIDAEKRDSFVSITENKIFLVKEISLYIPNNYNHQDRLNYFHRYHYWHIHPWLIQRRPTDKIFKETDYQINPGKTYKVKFYGIKENKELSLKELFKIFQLNSGYCFGVYGDTALFEYARYELTKNAYYFSLGKKGKSDVDIPEEFYISTMHIHHEGLVLTTVSPEYKLVSPCIITIFC